MKRREEVRRADSRGAVQKIIDAKIANLDQWQKKAAIEIPEGPQRIRGLAGSGKTIVLAQKASYLHALNKEANIAVCFYTQALYQHLEALIRRFSYDFTRDEPNWERVQILHCWGSRSKKGLYSHLAPRYGLDLMDYRSATKAFGEKEAFAGICRELLAHIKRDKNCQIFDAILIDEAQDMPQEFFEICYLVTKPPKKVIFAYDELQNLSDYTMPSVEKLFGSLSPVNNAVL